MTPHRVLLCCGFLLVVSLLAFPAWACSYAAPTPHETTPNAQDTQGPVLNEVAVSVTRGQGPKQEGCGSFSSSTCDDGGAVHFDVHDSTDDTSATANIGYIVEIVSGNAPVSITAEEPIRASRGVLFRRWTDGATDDQQPLNFVVRIFPLDEAGNVGDPVTVTVSDPGSEEGCQTAPDRNPAFLPTLLVLLFLAVMRRSECTVV